MIPRLTIQKFCLLVVVNVPYIETVNVWQKWHLNILEKTPPPLTIVAAILNCICIWTLLFKTLKIYWKTIVTNSNQTILAKSSPVLFNPVQFNPVLFNPVQFNPVLFNPVQYNPVLSNNVQYHSVTFIPVQIQACSI